MVRRGRDGDRNGEEGEVGREMGRGRKDEGGSGRRTGRKGGGIEKGGKIRMKCKRERMMGKNEGKGRGKRGKWEAGE